MSKFSGLMQARQPLSQLSEVVDQAAEVTPAPIEVETKAKKTEAIDMQPRRGKHVNPDYTQVTIYVKKETHKKAKIALLQSGNDRDFSELVEDLLAKFLTV